MTFEQQVAEGLVLRTVCNQADQDAYATFNAVYNNALEGASGACLLHHHPETTFDDFWLVEDETNGQIISTTCLIPWTSSYAGVELRLAQLEMVLTHPNYRGRGLLRAQMMNFERAANERGFDLCIIWGIPYFYRQYGYGYSLEGLSFEVLPVWKIPARHLGAAASLRLRPASSEDIPLLVQHYERTTSVLDFHIRRSADYWKYLLEAAKHPIEMVENAETGEVQGYIIVTRSSQSIRIQESSVPDTLVAYALLLAFKAQCSEQIMIFHPLDNTLAQVARSLGSQPGTWGQWLVRIPDWVRFLTKIAPVFERRLAASGWSHLSGDLMINFFREAYRVHFEQGRLAAVVPLGFVDSSMGADGGDLCIPPDAFVRLVTGYRGFDELWDAWPDMVVKPEARGLINTLFPKMNTYLSAPYHYLGPVEDK